MMRYQAAVVLLGILICAGPVRSQSSAAASRALLNQYCVGCHNQKLKTAGLMLDQVDLEHAGAHAEILEKVVRKLRAGMMPPSGMPRPDAATRESLVSWLENELDRNAVT